MTRLLELIRSSDVVTVPTIVVAVLFGWHRWLAGRSGDGPARWRRVCLGVALALSSLGGALLAGKLVEGIGLAYIRAHVGSFWICRFDPLTHRGAFALGVLGAVLVGTGQGAGKRHAFYAAGGTLLVAASHLYP